MQVTLEEIVGSMAFRSRTKLPSRQKVRLARGSNKPGSVQRHFTSGPTFSITSNLAMPPSTSNSSPILTSVHKYLRLKPTILAYPPFFCFSQLCLLMGNSTKQVNWHLTNLHDRIVIHKIKTSSLYFSQKPASVSI